LNNLIYANTNVGFKDFLTVSFQKPVNRYLECFRKCKEKRSERSVHDLRVSIRRLGVMLEILNSIVESNYIPASKQLIRKQFKGLSKLRDVQVMITKIKQMIVDYPVIYGFYEHLIKSERKLIKRLSKILNENDYSDIKGIFTFLKLELTDKIVSSGLNFDILIQKTDQLFLQLDQTAKSIAKKDIETIHQTRIAFKKFRYLCEFQMPAYSEHSFTHKEFADYQTKMGVLQDISVLLDELVSYINNTYSLKKHIPILSNIFEEEKLLLDEYLTHQNDYMKFWQVSQKNNN